MTNLMLFFVAGVVVGYKLHESGYKVNVKTPDTHK